jgi:hypothetical protein
MTGHLSFDTFVTYVWRDLPPRSLVTFVPILGGEIWRVGAIKVTDGSSDVMSVTHWTPAAELASPKFASSPCCTLCCSPVPPVYLQPVSSPVPVYLYQYLDCATLYLSNHHASLLAPSSNFPNVWKVWKWFLWLVLPCFVVAWMCLAIWTISLS